MIIQIENALSDQDCHCLAKMYDQHVHLSKEQYLHLSKEREQSPILFWYHLEALSGAIEIFQRVVSECSDKIIESFGLERLLYPETVILARMGPGGYHPRHADNSRQDEQGNWVPNHSPQRDLSAIYYLNGDFEGGELVFPRHGLTIKPRIGLLVAFPGDGDHMHEVVPVRTGFRYTLPIWFTKQEAFGLKNLSSSEAPIHPR